MPQPNPITIRYLINQFEAIAIAGGSIKTFFQGPKFDVDENVKNFPALVCDSESYNPNFPDYPQTVEFSFLIMLIDLVNEDLTNENDVCSRCATMIDEFISAVNKFTRDENQLWSISRVQGRQKILDATTTIVAGWVIELFIVAPFANCS